MLFWQPGPNLWVGVRLPWTLADRAIWRKSWRLASRLLMVMGITVLISWRAFLISTIHLVGLTCLYTALRYRWKYGTWRFWKDLGWIDFRPVVRCRHCGHFQKLRDEWELPGSFAPPVAASAAASSEAAYKKQKTKKNRSFILPMPPRGRPGVSQGLPLTSKL